MSHDDSPFLMLHTWLGQVKLPRGPPEARLNMSFGQAPAQRGLRWPHPHPHPHPNQAPAAQVGQRPAQIMMYVATLLPLRPSSSSPLKFCYMCLNGGKLHLCDHCPWAVCHQCLLPPHDLDISNLDFICLACHEVAFKAEPRQPYYVSCQVTLLRCLPLICSCLHLAGVLCLFQARHKYALSDAWPLETCHSPAPCLPRPISNDLPLPSQLRQPPYSPFDSGES